jgi:hypothetical protein
VTAEPEGEAERGWRRYQRGLFDGVARRVIGVESTQVTSRPEDVRRQLAALRRLDGRAEAGLTLEASFTPARVLGAVTGG